MANIILNGNCNRQCVYCFSQLKDRKNSRLSLDNLTFISDFFARSKKRKINILGGEPTLHPQFDIFLEYLMSRGFVIHVFTNGMISAAMLKKIEGVISRWQLTRQRLKFIVNVNEEKYRTQKEEKSQQRTFCHLHGFATLSFNIFEKECQMDFLLALIAQNQLIPEIRLGLAVPILGKSNRFLVLEDYPAIVKKIITFSGQCQNDSVDLVFDCGFPLCVFSDEEIGKLYKNKTQLKFICHPIPDIDPELNVTYCYPLSGFFPKKLTDFRNLQDIYTYFNSQVAKNKQIPGIFDSCPECEYRHRGMCDGGCRAHYLSTREHIV
jgi:radical SAM protein with 4Fe4S-binding SPASM domain